MKTNTCRKAKMYGPKNEIYSLESNGSFYSPFSLSVDEMEHLILINFEKDPDEYYNTFELQQACDKNDKKFLLVIAYRNDGGADIYHQSAYPLASQANILNDVNFIVSPLEDAVFDINPKQLNVFFAFEDKYGRKIKVKVIENRSRKRNPFFLLAPVGIVAQEPKSLPIYSLYEMSFSKQKYTDIEIEINGVRHKPDTFPLPIDCSKNYFTRYSADTFNVDWNKNFNGPLSPLSPTENRIEARGISYELVNNNGHFEIKRMTAKNKRHHIYIDLFPPLPDIACLNDNIHNDGNFTITTDKSAGKISGEYYLEKQGNEIRFQFQPKGGWCPNEKRVILKFLFLAVKVFKNWPKSYSWNATITLDPKKHPMIKSSWKRIIV